MKNQNEDTGNIYKFDPLKDGKGYSKEAEKEKFLVKRKTLIFKPRFSIMPQESAASHFANLITEEQESPLKMKSSSILRSQQRDKKVRQLRPEPLKYHYEAAIDHQRDEIDNVWEQKKEHNIFLKEFDKKMWKLNQHSCADSIQQCRDVWPSIRVIGEPAKPAPKKKTPAERRNAQRQAQMNGTVICHEVKEFIPSFDKIDPGNKVAQHKRLKDLTKYLNNHIIRYTSFGGKQFNSKVPQNPKSKIFENCWSFIKSMKSNSSFT